MTQEQKKAALGKMKQKIPFYSEAYRQESSQPGNNVDQKKEEADLEEILEQLDDNVSDIVSKERAPEPIPQPPAQPPPGSAAGK